MINKKVIKEAARRLIKEFHPQSIILFGSYARGTANKHSDVDLLVICPFKKDRKKLMVEMDMALWGLGMARDIVILTLEEFKGGKGDPRHHSTIRMEGRNVAL